MNDLKMDMKQIMLDIGCDGQSALDRAFRSACMCKNKGIFGSRGYKPKAQPWAHQLPHYTQS
jgi:hypothetical protein